MRWGLGSFRRLILRVLIDGKFMKRGIFVSLLLNSDRYVRVMFLVRLIVGVARSAVFAFLFGNQKERKNCLVSLVLPILQFEKGGKKEKRKNNERFNSCLPRVDSYKVENPNETTVFRGSGELHTSSHRMRIEATGQYSRSNVVASNIVPVGPLVTVPTEHTALRRPNCRPPRRRIFPAKLSEAEHSSPPLLLLNAVSASMSPVCGSEVL